MKKQNHVFLNSNLSQHLEEFIDKLEKYNAKRPRPRRKKDYEYLRSFYKDFIRNRNRRAVEIQTKEYINTLEIAREQFPVRTMFNLCIDGRVMSVLAFGATAVMGSSLRVPGGMIRDYIRGTDGKLKLREDSMYARLLLRAFSNYHTDIIAEVFDSHVGCAARLGEEQLKGRAPEDAGLLADVSHKRQIAYATKRFFEEKYENKKMVVPIQTSFDPHTGFLYMGLEIDEVFSNARKSPKGYSSEVLKRLVEEKKIISTEKLASDPDIEKIFSRYRFSLDWRKEYIHSANKFWSAVADMKNEVFQKLEKIVLTVYPHLIGKNSLIQIEKEERMLLLLLNAFSGYLHNHTAESQVLQPEHEHVAHYPYGIHEEEGVSITEGGYPPYEISMFAVFSLDEKNLPANVDLASTLVRKNRLEGRVKDRYGMYSNEQEFAEASVPLVVQEVIRDEISETDWNKLERVDWSDLPTYWDTMTNMEFLEYLHSKADLPLRLVMGINNLRNRMKFLYDPSNPTSSLLVEHYKVALPAIVSRYRQTRVILPLVKLGFE